MAENAKKLGCGSVVLLVLIVGACSSSLSPRVPEPTSARDIATSNMGRVKASPSTVPAPVTTERPASPKPSPAQTAKTADPRDLACNAMKGADLAVASLGRKILEGGASSSDAQLLQAPLERVNNAYKKLDGDFYWYLVGQGNAMDLLAKSVASGDFYSAGVALDSYLNGDEFTRFCR